MAQCKPGYKKRGMNETSFSNNQRQKYHSRTMSRYVGQRRKSYSVWYLVSIQNVCNTVQEKRKYLFDVILVLVSRYLKYDITHDVIWEEKYFSDVILIRVLNYLRYDVIWEKKYWYNFYHGFKVSESVIHDVT